MKRNTPYMDPMGMFNHFRVLSSRIFLGVFFACTASYIPLYCCPSLCLFKLSEASVAIQNAYAPQKKQGFHMHVCPWLANLSSFKHIPTALIAMESTIFHAIVAKVHPIDVMRTKRTSWRTNHTFWILLAFIWANCLQFLHLNCLGILKGDSLSFHQRFGRHENFPQIHIHTTILS